MDSEEGEGETAPPFVLLADRSTRDVYVMALADEQSQEVFTPQMGSTPITSPRTPSTVFTAVGPISPSTGPSEFTSPHAVKAVERRKSPDASRYQIDSGAETLDEYVP